MSHALLTSRRFAPLFWCQFFSAFNDNLLKNALVFLILFDRGEAGDALITLAGGVFIAPFLFLSALGGQLADRFDKAFLARRLKLIEIAAALFAVAGFACRSIGLLFVALLMFGSIGALFGPIKYGILPDHVAREQLSAANARVEGATFLAILFGTIAGGLLMQGGGLPGALTSGMIVMAVLCWVASLFIPPAPPAALGVTVDPNLLRSTFRLLGALSDDARIWRASVITSLFWLIGAIMLSLLAPLVTHSLNGPESAVTVYLAVFAIAIAVGSGLASWLSGGRIVFLPVVVGALLIALCALDLGVAVIHFLAEPLILTPHAFFDDLIAWRVAIDLAILAIGGGLMVVPSFVAVQAWVDPGHRGRAVAAVNVLNAAFMVGGAIVIALLQAAGIGMPVLLFIISAVAFVSAVWIFRTMPSGSRSVAMSSGGRA